MAITADTRAAIPVSSIVRQAANALLGHAIDRLAARRERQRLRRTLLAYRGIDNGMLDDIGLSRAIVEGALAGEEAATEAFVNWMHARRIAQP